MKFIEKIEYDADSDCQVITLDNSKVLVIDENYICTYLNEDHYYSGAEAITIINRK